MNLLYAVEREYPVAVDRLWQAWADAAQLQEWYHPVGLSLVPGSVTSEVDIGGRWTVAVDVPQHGIVAYFFGRYTEVVPLERLVHTMAYTQDAHAFAERADDAPHHVVEVDFEARGDASWVRFTQFGEMDPAQAEGARQGMESYFESLDAFLKR